ncbi:1,4-alpha-glucan branching protein [Streptomyces sp. NPDC051561]|uniref:maltokinase N-terminal cap-like domain-containing protein n=1 Tax=Streptomyces sp. NPDC051561 TaxID=3365658 RepID=UPI003797066D
MAHIYSHTTLKPTKRELLSAWLPTRPWYQRSATAPELTPGRGFRLDDPAGEVGIEFHVIAEGTVVYLVPVTYRGAPLAGAPEHALVGTMEHGELGKRWMYDAGYDPVAVAQLLAAIEGRAEVQEQSVSDTAAKGFTRAYEGEGALETGEFSTSDSADGTGIRLPGGPVLRLARTLPAALPADALGRLVGPLVLPDGSATDTVFATLHA